MSIKHNKIVVLIVFSIILYKFSGNLYAENFNAGIVMWYSWWDSFWAKPRGGEVNHGLLAGPALSMNINSSFSISSQLLYGRFDDWTLERRYISTYENLGNTTLPRDEDGVADVERLDSDTTFSYYVSRKFKVFLGFKYFAVRSELRMNYFLPIEIPPSISITTSGSIDIDSVYYAMGPGFGIGYTIPLTNRLYLSLLSSCITMPYGKFMREVTDNNNGYVFSYNIPIALYGANVTASLSYYSEHFRTTFVAGIRYQYLIIRTYRDYDGIDSNAYKLHTVSHNRLDDHFYGLTFAAMYYF